MSNGWQMVPLGELLSPVSRQENVVPDRQYDMLGAHWYAEGLYTKETKYGSEIAATKVYRVEEGDFVYNRLFAWKGSFALATRDNHGCYVSNEFPCFAVNSNRLNPRFLFRYLSRESAWNDALGLSSGGTPTSRNRLKEEMLLRMTIPLPPLPEQQRIVAKVEELAAKIAEVKVLRSTGQQHARAVLQHEIGVVFNQLSAKCASRPFGSFNPHVTSGPRNWGRVYSGAGCRFYRAQDIGSEGQVLDDSKVFIQPPDGNQGRTAQLVSGDLLIVITGATVGRCSMFASDLEPGFVSQHVALCRLPKDVVDPAFALWALRGPQGQQQLLGQRYGQGKPGLNLGNIRQLSFPFPAIAEQRRIVAYLDDLQAKVDSLKAIQAQTQAELDALLPSILDKAFKGEL
jgi:type I restriction enzyme S subunit